MIFIKKSCLGQYPLFLLLLFSLSSGSGRDQEVYVLIDIVSFLSDILGIPSRYDFVLYIVAGVLALVLLDGILTFLFGSISSLTSRR